MFSPCNLQKRIPRFTFTLISEGHGGYDQERTVVLAHVPSAILWPVWNKEWLATYEQI